MPSDDETCAGGGLGFSKGGGSGGLGKAMANAGSIPHKTAANEVFMAGESMLRIPENGSIVSKEWRFSIRHGVAGLLSWSPTFFTGGRRPPGRVMALGKRHSVGGGEDWA